MTQAASTLNDSESSSGLAESALDPALALPEDDESVLDAASRFIAQDGRSHPPRALARTIDDAALGNVG